MQASSYKLIVGEFMGCLNSPPLGIFSIVLELIWEARIDSSFCFYTGPNCKIIRFAGDGISLWL